MSSATSAPTPVANSTSSALFAVCSSLSLCGSAFIIVTFLSDFIFSFKFLIPSISGHIGDRDVDALCKLEAILQTFFGLGSVSWYFCICINTYYALIHINLRSFSDVSVRPKLFRYHLFVWSLSSLFTVLVFDDVGRSEDGTCFYSGKHDVIRLFFILPLLIYLLAASALLVVIFRKRHMFSYQEGPRSRIFTRMVAFVCVFVFFWTFPLLYRLHQWVAEDEHEASPKALTILYELFISLEGFGNFCVWVSAPQFREYWSGARRNRPHQQKLMLEPRSSLDPNGSRYDDNFVSSNGAGRGAPLPFYDDDFEGDYAYSTSPFSDLPPEVPDIGMTPSSNNGLLMSVSNHGGAFGYQPPPLHPDPRDSSNYDVPHHANQQYPDYRQ